jgi:hypothetical protein
LPFLKRFPYGDEREFRAIYETKETKIQTLEIAIPLSCIERITLSPWIPATLAAHLKRTIRDIDGCENLEVVRSTLISNEEWKNLGDEAR